MWKKLKVPTPTLQTLQTRGKMFMHRIFHLASFSHRPAHFSALSHRHTIKCLEYLFLEYLLLEYDIPKYLFLECVFSPSIILTQTHTFFTRIWMSHNYNLLRISSSWISLFRISSPGIYFVQNISFSLISCLKYVFHFTSISLTSAHFSMGFQWGVANKLCHYFIFYL